MTKQKKKSYAPDRRGSQNSNVLLTEDEVLEIRALHGKMTQQQIADKFAVNVMTISHIVLRKNWKHI